MLAAGMLLNQMLHTVMADESQPLEVRQNVFKYFGTYSKVMITMFEITLGNWVPPARKLMDAQSEWWGIFIVVYRCMFCFAVVNVIRAVFITETNRVAAGDDEVAMMNKERAQKSYLAKVRDLFDELDDSGDGKVSWEEFQQLMTDKVMMTFLGTLDLEATDLENLFKLLDDGDGKVGHDEFIQGVMSLRGAAKSIDLVTLLKVTRKMDHKIDVIMGVAPPKSFNTSPRC